jgi:pimeloyl-ACP methyl ester carboxylesterase
VQAWAGVATVTLKAWWVAYINWRLEQAALSQLWAMSDRELKDIGLTRSQMPGVLRNREREPANARASTGQGGATKSAIVMSTKGDTMPKPARRKVVIALHCSGAGAGQWRKLGEALGSRYELATPEHYGCDGTGQWAGEHAFTLADEAARTIDLIDGIAGKVHLVGHSYGGGVALHVALARPGRIASLALYEPSAFHLLRAVADEEAAAFAEIADITRKTGLGVVAGDYRGAAAAFVDYWSGPGAWASLKPSVQAALVRWVPKAPLDFRALIEEPTPLAAYACLRMPTLVMRGEHAPRPTRKVAEMLPSTLPDAHLAVVDGAGHMGPLTHGSVVGELIATHIGTAEAAAWRECGRRPQRRAFSRHHGLQTLVGSVP